MNLILDSENQICPKIVIWGPNQTWSK